MRLHLLGHHMVQSAQRLPRVVVAVVLDGGAGEKVAPKKEPWQSKVFVVLKPRQ